MNSGTEPDPGQPPLIQQASPPALPIHKSKGGRQALLLLLNLCLALFLAGAVLSFMDDSLLLLFNVPILTGPRGILVTFATFIGLLVYVTMGFTPLIPKRLFLPVALFNPAALLLAIPAWIFFYSRGQQISWVVSLCQLILALLIVWRLGRGFAPHSWMVCDELLRARPSFSWANLLGFWAVNLLLVLPATAGYLLFCSSVAIGHFSEGFIALRPVGFTVQVRNYVRADGKSILLVPMSHIGEPEYYRSLSQSFPTNSTILVEGVTDDKNLLTNRITYKRMATSLGLAQQQKEFKPSPIQVVHADIDVDQFTPGTIGFLNMVMLIHAHGLTADNLLQLFRSSTPPEFEEQLFADILHKRNRHLLGQIQQQLALSDKLVVPWGAAHMPEIAREIQQSGFHLDSAHEYVAIRFHHHPQAAPGPE